MKFFRLTAAVPAAFAMALFPALAWAGLSDEAEASSSAGSTNAVASESLTLEEAYDLTLRSDQSIRVALEQIRIANLQPWSALTRIAPQVTANGSYTTTNVRNGSAAAGFGSGASANPDLKRADITLNQPLLDLTVFPVYHQGLLAERVARLQRNLAIRNVLFGVAQAYYGILKQQSIASVDREVVRLTGEQLDAAQARFDVGEVTMTDVLAARTTLEQARAALFRAENDLQAARDQLSSILNMDFHRIIAVSEPPSEPQKLPDLDAVVLRAREAREDVQVGRLAVEQAKTTRSEVVAEYGPRLSAQLSENWADPASVGNRNPYWQAGLAVQLPIFEGGQREIDLIQAGYQINIAKLNLETTQKTAALDVRNAWFMAKTARAVLATLRVAVESAEKNYANQRERYRAGEATSLDVLDAVRNLQAARSDLASQTYDYQVDLLNLEKAIGDFQDSRVARVARP
ncbi:MAG: TolC family protein [Verrucomicrobiae bacterium]|nr:TolC family protein [Verrucomicrobiae bacterium]